MEKKFYESKTFWVNVIAFAVAVAGAFDLIGPLDAGWEPYVVPVIALLNIVLRFFTSKSIAL